jgi:hypothetical protein
MSNQRKTSDVLRALQETLDTAEVLYVLVRQYKPKRIIEVGSGFSTYLMAKACLKNYEETRKETDYIVIDPFPNATVSKGVPGVSRLIAKPVEQVPIETFLALDENDFFFIDSSHVARIGGDVNYELLEILPRLKKGVVVHLHDIFLPYEYPKQFIFGFHRFWTEQYLLQSFLTLNFAFEVLWSGFYMYMKYPDECRATFPSFRENKEGGPASFWIRRKV